ncbi:MAG: AraC family transcriptional regulator [Bacteroidetes bacterium]|nr:AraC family transcriptional regulator [Bacteroidota bacterium]
MKELLEEIKLNPNESFFIGVFQDHIDKSRWHYHQEYELSFITEGAGKRIVGDSTEAFNTGDLIFIGPRIPHVWFPDSTHKRQHSGRTLESVYLLFNQDILPGSLTSLPEFANIRNAIHLSERGIKITGDTLNEVSRIMLQLPYMNNMKRLMLFYEIMDLIGKSDSFSYLASADYVKTKFATSNTRVNRIHEFLMKNYQDDIDLAEVAEIAHMAPASVCRFFKGATGLTIFEYLNKIKIDFSCQLLLNTDLNILDISYDCGFNNLSHFNKQFKKFIGNTPTQFRNFRDSM